MSTMMQTVKPKKLNGEPMKDETKLALLEQSIAHINQTLLRFEKRFDALDSKFESIDRRFEEVNSKIDSHFKWILTIYFAGFGSLFGIIAHALHWF